MKTLSLSSKKKDYLRHTSNSIPPFRGVISFELLFALFLFAGLYKGDPRLAWVPVDLTAFFFGLSVISGLVILLKRGIVINRKAFILCVLYIAFAGYVLLTFIWTPGRIYSTQKVLYIWTLVLWAVAAPALIISADPSRIKRLGTIFILLSIIISFEAISQYIQAGQPGFIRVFGSNYLGLGRIAGLALIFLYAYLLFWARSSLAKLLAVASAGLFLWVLLVGGARGPFIAAALSALMPILFAAHISLKRQVIKVERFAVPIIIITIAVIALLAFFYQTGQMTQTMYRLQVLTSDGMGDSVEARMQHYVHAIEYWKQAPLLGNGIGSWPIINGDIDVRSYPHNLILEILVELGLVGLILFSLPILYALTILKPPPGYDQSINILLLMLIIYMFLNSMVSGDIPDNRLLFACIGLTPAALYFRGKKYG